MTSTPSLPAQIEAVRALIERYEDGKYCPPDVLAAALVTLQQHERLDAEYAHLSETAGEDYERGVQSGMKLSADHIERLEAECERRKGQLNRVAGVLAEANGHVERLEAVAKAARDLLRHAGIKHPSADTVIVSRERLHTLENALAALDTAAPETPDMPPSVPAERGE